MTPYRERREKGHYDSPTNTPASVHSHHLPGLMTAPPQETSTNAQATVEITNTTADVAPMPPSAAPEDFAGFNKTELLTLAKERGLSPANAAMSKAELRAALEANQ